MTWQPEFGAWPSGDGVGFRVWAPEKDSLDVAVYPPQGKPSFHPLQKDKDGCFTGVVAGIGAGTRYKYRLPNHDQFPDPASRFQPEGVHGLSEVIDPSTYVWNDQHWPGIDYEKLVVYELHTGTFTPEGTFLGIINKLPYLKDLGVTAIELMPVADFPGQRNWGYDGVDLFAPARCYGHPDDLRRLMDAAHQTGLAMLLDVVYNHLGPDGNYTGVYSPYYVSTKHASPWGAALNFDERHSKMVRDFFIDNAIYWLHDFHFDGLRLDATHAIQDDSKQHFLAEMTARVRAALPDRKIHLIAEDHRNLAKMAMPRDQGGWGLNGVWADDFHHEMRCFLAGDNEGYYRDYTGTTEDIATTVRQGWFFTGQYSQHLEEPRGTDPSPLPPRAFIICLQNHDQIGNRAMGERLTHQIDLASWRAATALFMCVPQTPLLFMGQEWAASTPFLYFTHHNEELGKLVTEGRRKEFRHFSAFSDPKNREKIPDPQADSTFNACRLIWEEQQKQPHAGVLKLYRKLLHLRQTEPALQPASRSNYDCTALGDSAVALVRSDSDGNVLVVVSQLKGAGKVNLQGAGNIPQGAGWDVLLTTEDSDFVTDPQAIRIQFSGPVPLLHFSRPGAALLKKR